MASSSLKIVRHPEVPIAYWYENRDSIQMDPPYQRKGDIWNDSDKAYLIDSIINGFDIPKFYLTDFGMRSSELNTNNAVYAIIDGKQRFQAIFDFIDGKIFLRKDFKFRLDPGVIAGGLSYKDLRFLYPELAHRFSQATLDVMSVSTDDPEDINELFKRLNKGKALVGAEVRNAALGPVAEMIRVVSGHDFFTQTVRFSTLRMGDQNAAAKILRFEYYGYPTGTKKSDLDKFVRSESPDNEQIESAGLKCLSHLDLLVQIFELRDKLLSAAGQIPAYYWMVRQCPYAAHSYVRAFLVDFERRRVESRAAQSAGRLNEVDPTLAQYDVLNRSTNDSVNHRVRISILLNQLSSWLKPTDLELATEVRQSAEEYVSGLVERGIRFPT